VHLVALDEVVDDLHADVGFELIVLLQHFGGQSAELAADVLDAEHEPVERLLPDRRRRSGQRRDETYLELVRGQRRGGDKRCTQGERKDALLVHGGGPPRACVRGV
jgi:hypothetical protein